MDSFTEDEREAKHKARVELEKQMAEFLAKGRQGREIGTGHSQGCNRIHGCQTAIFRCRHKETSEGTEWTYRN